MSDKPSPIRQLVGKAIAATDNIEVEMLIADFESTHRIDTYAEWRLEMGLVAMRQQAAAEEIQRLEELLIGLGVDPHATV